MQLSQPFLHKIALFLCSYESWESEDFKTILTLTYGGFQTKVMSLSILTWVFFRHLVSIMSHFGIFYNLSYCHMTWHISDNLSPNLISRYIPRKKRTRAFIWHQTWWDFRPYCWRYWLLKRGRIYLIALVYSGIRGCTGLYGRGDQV